MSWAYWKQVLIALDQLLNTLFRGYADETVLARVEALRQRRQEMALPPH